jgi:hypothetical protein
MLYALLGLIDEKMKGTFFTRNINVGIVVVVNGELGSVVVVVGLQTSNPEKMSENGPVVAEILQIQVSRYFCRRYR